MEKDKNKKQKIKIKAITSIDKKFILEKKFLIEERKSVLILDKEAEKFNEKKLNDNKKSTKLKIIPPNLIKLNKPGVNANKKILTVSKISKSLGGRPILKNISFELNQGQILGLLGPNGAGKSTLFNLIVGKIFPDFGKIKLDNEIINQLPIHKRSLKGISLLEQHKGLFGNMTAYENLYAILELYIEDKNKIETRIFQLLSYFGLQYLADVKANNMSGGEYKKISTLQRICNKNIKVLLLDEPMAALDPLSISSIKKFILELRSMGLSVIITDHNFFAIQDILDHCIIIRDGSIMVEGPPKIIMKDERAIKYYLGSGFKI
ncbi:MAG: ATP-binding cassette domain-containing protein [Pelagibacteraceae bacterium]|nr:ATP-binding cassette domain-containing protein [Pelagibacteraceae bacterium]MCI5079628.1 ATP-binding cassette domain-containing protein [Pelagibacteraceae bacterium]